MTDRAGIVVVGAGPTGLGAAWRLTEIGYPSWCLLEARDEPGGLAASVTDPQGFTWDRGGHVLFSHYDYFDRLMDDLLAGEWVEHVREAWIWMRERFIPYPLQNNIWRLPEEDLIRCLEGLVAVRGPDGAGPRPIRTFQDWIVATFGDGLAAVFMVPYNRKAWAYEPSELGVGWMGERVATVDLARVLRNLVRQQDDAGWGPNATFRFPLRGGTGTIWRRLLARLPADRVRLGHRVVAVRTGRRRLRLADGREIGYERLVSTMPLDLLLGAVEDRPDLGRQAHRFRHSSTHLVGVGLDGRVPEILRTKCWMYFPEPDVPFYRVTVFSNYSPLNVPRPGEQWSLLCEVSASTHRPVVQEALPRQVLAGLRQVGLLPTDATIASLWQERLTHGYPTPFLDRDAVLEEVEPVLRDLGIYSRGRFGAWKYEVSNQDHSLMQGVEAVDHLVFGDPETTVRDPARVNARGAPAPRSTASCRGGPQGA